MRLLITAGPTREPIDAVRFISNRSTGRVGLSLAAAGAARGHEVTLLLGPGPDERDVSPLLDAGCRVYRFDSSAELKQLLEAHFRGQDCDALIMAAAVSDYRPAVVAEGKLPSDKSAGLRLTLAPTPDLVKLMTALRQPGQRIVAFALEEAAQLEERALAKMQRKGVDAIVANPLGTMESEGITAIWLTAAGGREAAPRMSKDAFGHWLIERVEALVPRR